MRIAWFSPLPPLASGVADYSANLLRAFDRVCGDDLAIDLVVDRGYTVDDADLRGRHRVVSVAEFRREQERGGYDRRLFHLGNVSFHAYLLEPLFDYGGAVVLHETLLDGLAVWVHHRMDGGLSEVPARALPRDFWRAVRPQVAAAGFPEVALAAVLLQAIAGAADGILVHSRHAATMLEAAVPGLVPPVVTSALGTAVPAAVDDAERAVIRARLGFSPEETIFAAFGLVQPDKGIEAIVSALDRAAIPNARLLLVGGVNRSFEPWLDRLVASTTTTRVRTTGRLEGELFHDHMRACDVAFALRVTSRGESSAALLDLLGHGVPTIVYDQGSFAELPGDAVVKVPARSIEPLAEVSSALAMDRDRRALIAAGSRAYAESMSFETRVADYLELLGISREM